MIPTLSPATTITGSHSAATEPFYGIAAFGLFSPLALIYSAVARLIFGGLGARSSNAVIVQQLPPTAPSLHPKRVAIVTGSNTGIGFETAKALVLEHGMEVILACRSRNKAMLAADSINKEMAPSCRSSDGGAIFTVPLDLTSWVSIQQFAASITARYEEIHVLVNNAGRNTSGPNGRLDLLFQSNFLGHFLLTQLLLGHLIKGKGRIVNLSSVMHHFCASSVPLSNPDYWNNCALYDRSPRETYVPSKLAAILFTLELQRRYGNQGITAVSVNPGAV
jgi:NAD(P)-dependent dehydrogenase (short-subunit alcohol dehydrogenase family)